MSETQQLPSIQPSTPSPAQFIPPPPANLTTANLPQENARAAAAQIAFFRAIPWCNALLSRPRIVIDQSVSRQLKPPTSGLDTLLSKTLNTLSTIPAYVTFYVLPETAEDLIGEVHSLLALGHDVNGWEGICHGGLVVTLIDEVMGQVFAVNRNSGRLKGGDDVMPVTGWLNTRFERPVKTGSGREGDEVKVVLVSARLVKRDGRKFFLEGEVRADEGRVVCARGEACFVLVKEKL
ncbi:uncharacterized protein CTHT_0064170 [Thermochaetoides thermophila DSM 1495]|uniref:Thioesterase domain-containing protein n=1 Tax=Chaetomium thermophilum (strain DSM 1495 / CBS 144.50 / IMI 039719) TaxID=759272 RepID=G0SEL5_CHATD|nr:hypothetical protein CTHT_0064170 [Thermochaetoides thermophila DSM 1495]EGS18392.1 hypothetical protein CTHT_0064170 [Thermochaetoides thermophila DSM 1495]